MDKFESIQLFLRFWFSPWGAAKGEVWEEFSKNMPLHDRSAEYIIQSLLKEEGGFDMSLLKRYNPKTAMTYEEFILLFADALEQFAKIPEGMDTPGNAATLWKAIKHGWSRVASRLRQYRES